MTNSKDQETLDKVISISTAAFVAVMKVFKTWSLCDFITLLWSVSASLTASANLFLITQPPSLSQIQHLNLELVCPRVATAFPEEAGKLVPACVHCPKLSPFPEVVLAVCCLVIRRKI